MKNLNEKAMLGSLNISSWSGKKYDSKISNEVAVKYGSDPSMGRYNKQLLAKRHLDAINKIIGTMRAEFNELTLPWLNDGSRILTSQAYFTIKQKFNKYAEEFEAAKNEFLANYEDYVQEVKTMLNGQFNRDDYPSLAKMKNKFRCAVHFYPLPIREDFRVNIVDEEAERIKQQIEDSTALAVSEALASVWQRIKIPVAKMVERLRIYKVTADGVENAFRDSLVENLREMLELIPTLNITDDTEIIKICNEIKGELCRHDANQLRDNDGLREIIADRAEAILDKISAYV